MKLDKFLYTTLLSFVIVACSTPDSDIEMQSIGSELSITTRSSSSFTTQDQICVADISNDKSATYIYDGTSWGCDTPLIWSDDNSVAMELMSYQVKSGATPTSIILGEDGTTINQEDNLTQYDYIYCYTPEALRTASPAIDLELEHKMAKVIISISSDDAIEAVSLTSPASMDFENGVWTPSANQNVTVNADADGNVYTCYVIPHTWSNPQVTIDNLTATYEGDITLSAGNEYSIAIRTSTEENLATFASNFTVNEWGSSLVLGDMSSPAMVWDGESADSFGGGTGVVDDPYLITSPSELSYLADMVNGGTNYFGLYFQLTTDLDLNNIPWNPIGVAMAISFNGRFDGGNHTIYNLYVDTSDNTDASSGLFGTIKTSANGYLKNLTIVDPTIIASGGNTGVFIGYAQNYLTMSNCVVEGGTVVNTSGASNKYMGCLVGQANQNGNSFYSCKVIGTKISGGGGSQKVGGFIGIAGQGTNFIGCTVSNVEISNLAGITGGFVAESQLNTNTTVEVNSNFSGCSVSGTISGGASVSGGFIGASVAYANVNGCYSTVTMNDCSGYVGGFIGSFIVSDEDSASEVTERINSSYATWSDGGAIGRIYYSSTTLETEYTGAIKVTSINNNQLTAMNASIESVACHNATYSCEYVPTSNYGVGLPYIVESVSIEDVE